VKTYRITIQLKSDLHIGSGFGFARIIDNMSVEDEEGLAYVPGSTIKGKLRSVCKKIVLTLGDKAFLNNEEKICQSFASTKGQEGLCKHIEQKHRCVICRLFGSPFAEGKLLFTDAKLDEVHAEEIRVLLKINRFHISTQNEVRTNVKVSRTRKLAEDGHLFVSENVRKSLVFTGLLYIKEPLSSDEEMLLHYGLKALTHLGGQKSRGLGRVEMKLEEVT